LKISNNGLALIKRFEGCRLTAYADMGGVWTIGWGQTGPDVVEGLTITQAQADARLRIEVDRFAAGVSAELKVPVNQNQFDALVSLAYNIGLNAFRTSTLLRLLNDRTQVSIVASEFIKWNKVNGKSTEGLSRRREAERQLFLVKDRHPLMASSIVAQRDTWLKHEPKQASELEAERKLFVPKGSAHRWRAITMVPGEAHYKLTLEAQPERTWWMWPPDFKIINDPKEPEEPLAPPATPAPRILSVPYYSQRDNQVDPMRTCFSSSCAMLLKFLKPSSISGDDEYIKTVYSYGDTVYYENQIKALAHYGQKAVFRKDYNWARIDAQLERGIPVPIGILHHGSVTAPTGGGHWLIIIGRSQDNTRYVVNDPFGDCDLVNGGYLSPNGKGLLYSKKNLGPRFMVEGPDTGYVIEAVK
jgi:GH24 family phage-related lysozyme (muramidase)